MGYTHYWRRAAELPAGTYNRFQEINRGMLDCLSKKVALRGPDGTGEPVIGTDALAFNGDARVDHDHEPLVFNRVLQLRTWDDPETPRHFRFCKTAVKPYDIAVCAVLINAAQCFGQDLVKMSSDGTTEDWREARDFYEMFSGQKAPDWGPWSDQPEEDS